MREADRVNIHKGQRKEVVRGGFLEEVKLEAFTSGKEKEILYAEQTACARAQNMANSRDGSCNKVGMRKSNFSNVSIIHNFLFVNYNKF